MNNIQTVDGLRKAATAIYLATAEPVAQDIALKLNWAANEIQRLKDELKNQCIKCPLDRRYDDSGHPTFLRRQAD